MPAGEGWGKENFKNRERGLARGRIRGCRIDFRKAGKI